MFKKITTIASLLALSFSTAFAESDVVEQNVSISLKFTWNPTEDYVKVGKSMVLNTQSYAIRNADFIQMANDAYEGREFFPFDKKTSRIICQNFHNTPKPVRYLLRNKAGKEADITGMFLLTSRGVFVKKGKYLESTGLGTYSGLLSETFQLTPSPGVEDSSIFTGATLSKVSSKTVLIKGAHGSVPLLNHVYQMTGVAELNLNGGWKTGIIEGALSVNAPKLIIHKDLPQ